MAENNAQEATGYEHFLELLDARKMHAARVVYDKLEGDDKKLAFEFLCAEQKEYPLSIKAFQEECVRGGRDLF